MRVVENGRLIPKMLIALEVWKLVGSLMDEDDQRIWEEQLPSYFLNQMGKSRFLASD